MPVFYLPGRSRFVSGAEKHLNVKKPENPDILLTQKSIT